MLCRSHVKLKNSTVEQGCLVCPLSFNVHAEAMARITSGVVNDGVKVRGEPV